MGRVRGRVRRKVVVWRTSWAGPRRVRPLVRALGGLVLVASALVPAAGAFVVSDGRLVDAGWLMAPAGSAGRADARAQPTPAEATAATTRFLTCTQARFMRS